MIHLVGTNSLSTTTQGQSKVPSLEGSEWEVKVKQSSPDGMLQIATYAFRRQGEVVLSITTANSAWTRPRIQYNSPGSGRVEEERGRAVVVPGVPPGSIASTVSEAGTYKQHGNSVHLEFPDHTVDATIFGNRIEGEILYKQTNIKEKWAVTKISAVTNTSSAGMAPISPKPEPNLKLRANGSYNASALEVLVDSRFGISWGETSVNATLKIASLSDKDIKVDVLIDGRNYRQGTLTGFIDSYGNLQLRGQLVDSSRAVFETQLSLTLVDGSLSKGNYVSGYGIFTITGKLSF